MSVNEEDDPRSPASRGAAALENATGTCFEVVSSESVARTLVAAYLRASRPLANVIERNDTGVVGGVRIELAGSGRWMFIVADWGASEELAQAVSGGASAVLSLGAHSIELELAVDALLQRGALYVSPAAARWMAEAALRPRAEASAEAHGVPELTVREQEVLELVGEGLSNDEIATSLAISASTVRTHLHSLSLKLDATSRAGLIAKAQAIVAPAVHPVPIRERTA